MLGDISCPGGHTAPRLTSREAGSGASGRFASSYIKRQASYRLLWPEGERSRVLLCAKVCRAKNGGWAKDEPEPECRSQQSAAARHHGQGDQFGDGKTVTVIIQDRGPHRGGRVVDVSPKAAEQLGLKKRGVAPVEVSPIAVPQKDGNVKLGAGA